MSTLLEAARKMLAAGLTVLPASLAQKRPLVEWSPYHRGERRLTPHDIESWFGCDWPARDALCIVTGYHCSNIEALDFDANGELFAPWCDLVGARDNSIIGQCVIEKSPSGGRHVFYRVDCLNVPGNLKLATRAGVTMIETRGTGGIVLCAPSPGYELLNLDFATLPVLDHNQRDILVSSARSFNEAIQPQHGHRQAQAGQPTGEVMPGEDFSRRGDPRPHLIRAGWRMTKGGDNEHWLRPGKESGVSATLKGQVFFVFSSNASPFESGHGYGPFAVYAMLEHGGDWGRAAAELRRAGYGADRPLHQTEPVAMNDVDLSALEGGFTAPETTPEGLKDAGGMKSQEEPEIASGRPLAQAENTEREGHDENEPDGHHSIISDELMRVPGFISEYIDYCAENAPQPNPVQAFAGALAMQSFLAGRKVRDPLNNRTHLYILGLAHSASGKDFARQVNFTIGYGAGFVGGEIAGRFVSGEGVEDALQRTPSMMFQVDEIDGMLAGISKNRKDGNGKPDSLMMTLLTAYTSGAGYYPMRRRANGEHSCNGVINQPSLTIYGTAIPANYYEAISERMLSNGFFARCMVLESGLRAPGRDVERMEPVPPRLILAAKWWREFSPGGNMSDFTPQPAMVEYTADAKQIMFSLRELADHECREGEQRNDTIATSAWGRVHEHARKLALIYAASENKEAPIIGQKAAEWGAALSTFQCSRALRVAKSHVADSEFEADALKLMGYIRHQGTVSHKDCLRKMRMKARDFADLIGTLIDRGDVLERIEATATQPGKYYSISRGR